MFVLVMSVLVIFLLQYFVVRAVSLSLTGLIDINIGTLEHCNTQGDTIKDSPHRHQSSPEEDSSQVKILRLKFIKVTRLTTAKVSTANADRLQQRWTCQLLRGSAQLSRQPPDRYNVGSISPPRASRLPHPPIHNFPG